MPKRLTKEEAAELLETHAQLIKDLNAVLERLEDEVRNLRAAQENAGERLEAIENLLTSRRMD